MMRWIVVRVELKDIRSVPVGYMAEKEMFPLDFEEFAEAVGMSTGVMTHVKECYEQCKVVDEVVHNTVE